MGRKNYPPKEKKKRKLEAGTRKTKLGQELIAGLQEAVMIIPSQVKKPITGRAVLGGMPPWKKKLLASFKKRK